MGGVYLHACAAISSYSDDHNQNGDTVGSITVGNNIIKNFTYTGVDLEVAGTATAGSLISNNAFDNLSPTDTPVTPYGIAVYVGTNFYADITGNHMTRARKGIQTGNFHLANPGSPVQISGNVIESWNSGIWHNLQYASASPFEIANNTLTAAAGSANNIGLRVTSIQSAVTANIHDNIISGGAVGIGVWNVPTTAGITISGGSVAGAQTGLLFWNNELSPPDGSSGYGKSPGGSLTLSGLAITGCTVYGIRISDDPTNSDPSAALYLTATDLTVTSDVVGVRSKTPGLRRPSLRAICRATPASGPTTSGDP